MWICYQLITGEAYHFALKMSPIPECVFCVYVSSSFFFFFPKLV